MNMPNSGEGDKEEIAMLCYRIKWITVTLFLLVLLIALTGCNHNDDQQSAKETADYHETESLLFHDRVAMETPIRRLNIQSAYHEGYLYFFVLDESGYEIGKRMNLATGEISSPCNDPLCSHNDRDCPFVGGSRSGIKVFGEWLVIQTNFSKGGRRMPERKLYHITTGEWTEIFKSEDGDATQSSNVMRIGNYLYHVTFGKQKISNGETYLPSDVQRYNLKTGEEEVIFSHPYMIDVIMASESRLYFREDIAGELRFYSIDMDGNDFKEEPTIKMEPGYAYQNKVYSSTYMEDEYVEQYPIFMNDLTTGDVVMVAEDHVMGSMCIFENHLYYLEKEGYAKSFAEAQAVMAQAKAEAEKTGTAIVPNRTEPYASQLAEITHRRNTAMGYLWKCDLDGSNRELVLELPGVGDLNFYIWDGYLYTEYEFWDTTTGELLGTKEEIDRPCRIDLTTGEVEFLHKLGAE